MAQVYRGKSSRASHRWSQFSYARSARRLYARVINRTKALNRRKDASLRLPRPYRHGTYVWRMPDSEPAIACGNARDQIDLRVAHA